MNNDKKTNIPHVLACFMWGLSAVFYFYEFLLQVSPTAMVDNLMSDLAIKGTAIGILAGFYYTAYAGMQIPVGVLIDRFGARLLLTIASLICAIGCLFFSMATSFSYAIIGRTLIGFGSAFAVVGCLSLAAHWFPPKRFAFLTGIMIMIGMIGAASGSMPIAIMLKFFTWRQTIFSFAIIGVILSLLFWFVLRDQPSTYHMSNTSKNPKPSLLEGLKHVIKSKQSWLSAAYGGLMFAPTIIFSSVWGTYFLMTSFQIPKPTAALITSCIFFGWAAGSPLVGWLSDAIGRRKPLMLYGSIGSLICITCIIYIPYLPEWLLAVLLFTFGLFSSGFFLAFAITREINPTQYSGTAVGFMNMMNTIGSMIAPPAIGYTLDFFWNGAILNGAPVYSLQTYQVALSILPIMIFAAIIVLPFIKETYCIPIDHNKTLTKNN